MLAFSFGECRNSNIGKADLRACEGTQAVLAILLQSVRRKIASFRLHRQPVQNSYGRNRPFWGQLLGCPAPELGTNKKLP